MIVRDPNLFRLALLALVLLVVVGPVVSNADGSESETHLEESMKGSEASTAVDNSSTDTSTQPENAEAAEPLGSAATSWIQFTDPATGELRRVTPEELRDFLLTARARGENGRSSGQSWETVLGDGTVIVHTDHSNRHLMFSAVNPAGDVSLSHSPDQLVQEATGQTFEPAEQSRQEAADDQ